MASKQSHQHSIVCYSESTIFVIGTIPQFEHVTYICHDSDLDSDGNLKKKHYHVLFRSKSSKTSSAVKKIINNALILFDPEYFNRSEHDNVFCEFVRNTSDILDYLIHKNSPDKFQYSVHSVQGDIQWWLDNVDDLSAQISRDKKDWTVSLMGLIQGYSYEHYILRSDVLEMATEYGRDFLLNLPRVLSSLREIYGHVSIVKELPSPHVSRETRDVDGRPCLIDADGLICLADRSSDNPFDEKK